MSIIRNISWYTLANIGGSGIQFLLLPLLTKSLTVNEFGTLAVFQIAVQILVPILMVGVESYLGVEIFRIDASQKGTLVRTLLSIPVLVFAIICTFAWLSFPSSVNAFGTAITRTDGILILLAAFAIVPHTFALTILRSENRPKTYMVYQLTYMSLNVLLTACFLSLEGAGIRFRLIAMILSTTHSTIFVLSRAQISAKNITLDYVKGALKFGYPLVFHSVCGILLLNSERLILGEYISSRAVGIYSAGSQLASILLIVGSGVNQAWSPFAFEKMTKKMLTTKQIFQILTLSYMAFTLAAGAITLILPFVLDALTSPQYKNAKEYLPFLVGANLFNCFYYLVSVFLFYFKKTKTLATITVSITVLTVAASSYLVPKWGIEAALWIKLFTWILFFTVTAIFTFRTLKKNQTSFERKIEPLR